MRSKSHIDSKYLVLLGVAVTILLIVLAVAAGRGDRTADTGGYTSAGPAAPVDNQGIIRQPDSGGIIPPGRGPVVRNAVLFRSPNGAVLPDLEPGLVKWDYNGHK